MSDTRLSEIDFQELYARWVQGAGPFACFVRKTNFVSLKHYDDFVLRPKTLRKNPLFKNLQSQLKALDPERILMFDIPAVQGMQLACLLQNHLGIKPILTYISPLHSHGLVGGDDYVNALISYGFLLKPVEPQTYVLILDSERYRTRISKQVLRRKFNNQYELTADDLPSAEMLGAIGYRQVCFYRRGVLKEDIAAYLQYLKENHIKVVEHTIGINGENQNDN